MLEPWKAELNLSITIEVIAADYNRATALVRDALRLFRNELESNGSVTVVDDSLDVRRLVVRKKY